MIRRYDGQDLEKILTYYGLLESNNLEKTKIICPFHGDINPSMSVDFTNGKYYCFGCGASGNALDFVRLVHPEYDDLQAVIALEKAIHSKNVERLNIKRKKAHRKNLNHLLNVAEDYFYSMRRVDWNQPEGGEQKAVLEYMYNRGYYARDLNIADCRVSNNKQYPIVFPILDNGRFCGYVCRTMDKDVEASRKYLYNEGMRKRGILCGCYEENKPLFVCEGLLDGLSIRTRGKIKNVVSLLGWHISDEQIEKIKKKNIRVVICALDNPEIDQAGEKGLNLLKKHFEKVIAFPYPKGEKDPGDMTREQMIAAVRRVKSEIVL